MSGLYDVLRQQVAADPFNAVATLVFLAAIVHTFAAARIAALAHRAPEGSVDMGTGYDCSDEKAHTASRAITPQQRKWRDTLVSAMARQGFVNFRLEWWHFSLPGGANEAYDFPVTRRR